jgi:prolipoprotein diacylglyceryltransferase
MYPNLYYAIKDLFGIHLSAFKLINTFGFFVAIAFIVAAWILTLELKRKQASGLLTFTESKIVVGAPASYAELLTNFLLGFLFGFKILGAFIIPDALNDPQSFILSTNGNWFAGLFLGIVSLLLKWWEKNKQKLAKPEERIIRIWPQDRVGDIVIYAAVFGFLGAKIFHNLENWNDFINHPIEALISFSGLTFYGGLICAATAIYFYGKKHHIPFIHLADAAAPALMIAYAIGRIGCQIAGDGDWGVLNSAFISNASGHIVAATHEQFNFALQTNKAFYSNQFGSLDQVPFVHFEAIKGLPQWLFAYNFPHNVINEGVPFAGCTDNYCSYLPIAVFPTPFYETVMASILFALLWVSKKKFKTAGRMFAVYLLVNGIERFTIEQIRVNTKYNFWGIHPTQAELIALLLIVGGILLYFLSPKFKINTVK